MSQRIFTIDKTLYEILTESPSCGFRPRELRDEYLSRSVECALAKNKRLFWRFYMHIHALKMLKLIRREKDSSGEDILFLEQHFWDYPFDIVEGLLLERGRLASPR